MNVEIVREAPDGPQRVRSVSFLCKRGAWREGLRSRCGTWST